VASKLAAAETSPQFGAVFDLPVPTTSSLSSVAQHHYLSSMQFDAKFGSELRKKVTNIIYNRKPAHLVRKKAAVANGV